MLRDIAKGLSLVGTDQRPTALQGACTRSARQELMAEPLRNASTCPGVSAPLAQESGTVDTLVRDSGLLLSTIALRLGNDDLMLSSKATCHCAES